MAITFSQFALKEMGYRSITPGEPIVATFQALHVYEIKGLTVEQGTVLLSKSTVAETPYQIAVGTRVNRLSRKLVNDDFTADEAAWSLEHNNCTPPYILIHFGPTTQHMLCEGYVKEEESGLTTLDSFPSAHTEICSMESKALPLIISALACTLDLANSYAQLKAVDKVIFGITTTGLMLRDRCPQVKGSAYAYTRQLATDELQTNIGRATSLALEINPKASRFFHMALKEEDLLKQFLYLFFSIEIETHNTYESIKHLVNEKRLDPIEERVHKTMMIYKDEWKSKKRFGLQNKFDWCAICKWAFMTDDDVENFKQLKKTRDDIAHGESSSPPFNTVVRTAERLAIKLLAAGNLSELSA